MAYATEHIAKTLREAREKKGLSQRALSALAGVPQGHISKIETGAVDLRLSSLIELARALDLELTLVPRNTVPAVQSIVRTSAPTDSPDPDTLRKTRNEVARLQNSFAHLPRNLLPAEEFSQFQRTLRELRNFSLPAAELQKIRDNVQTLNKSLVSSKDLQALRDSFKQLQQLRNQIVHNAPVQLVSPRPVYSLDEDDNA
jgi:transcriptional regulator with XRE-family HTH domain